MAKKVALVATPGFQGRLQLDLTSQMQGAETNVLWRSNDGEGLQLDGLAGFRWLQFSESLALTATTGAAAAALVSGFTTSQTASRRATTSGAVSSAPAPCTAIRLFASRLWRRSHWAACTTP